MTIGPELMYTLSDLLCIDNHMVLMFSPHFSV